MLHSIMKDNKCILVSGEYLRIFKINKMIGQGVNALSWDENCEVEKQIACANDFTLPNNNCSQVGKKLALIVTDNCNMACNYCYENEFRLNDCLKRNMSFEIAKRAIDYFYTKYPEGIENIHFFGGEPLLNVELIEKTCEYCYDICRSKKIDSPNFLISTNGTLINDNIINLFERYFKSITISLDGIKATNDKNRKLKNNSNESVYDKVSNNLKLMNRKKRKYRINLETTVTKQSIIYLLKNKTSAKEYVDFLFSLGCDDVHIKPVITFCEGEYSLEKINENELLDLFDEIYKEVIIKRGGVLTSSITRMFVKHEYSENYCNAGITSFAVGTGGNIYPCFMLNENENYQMGNVCSLENSVFDKIQKKFENIKKINNEKCRSCWANKLCQSTCASCVGAFELYNEKIDEPININCKIGCKMLDRYVIELSKQMDRKNGY